MSSKYAELISQVEETKTDADKFFEKGNKSAGTRLRKALQNIKKLSQEIRKEISEKKKEETA